MLRTVGNWGQDQTRVAWLRSWVHEVIAVCTGTKGRTADGKQLVSQVYIPLEASAMDAVLELTAGADPAEEPPIW